MIEFEVDTQGNPKGEVRGNIWCWLGAFEYVVKDAVPGKKLLTHYNKRDKRFGTKPIASKASRSWKGEVPPVQKLLQVFCKHAGIQRAETINIMWARKSFANTTLGELQLPASTVMSITGHKSEQTMRKYYHQTVALEQQRLGHFPVGSGSPPVGEIPRWFPSIYSRDGGRVVQRNR